MKHVLISAVAGMLFASSALATEIETKSLEELYADAVPRVESLSSERVAIRTIKPIIIWICSKNVFQKSKLHTALI